jgi:hypothetical protein
MNIRIGLLTLVAAVALSLSSNTAEAQGPGAGTLGNTAAAYYSGNYGYYQMLWRLYNTSHVPVPPYFALQPPVYYSQPVARPYGYSPYAYPRWVQTPQPKAPATKPAVVVNPFVTPKEKPADDTTAQMIFNPFVIDSAGLAGGN